MPWHYTFLYLKVPADPQVLASIEIRSAPSGAPEAYFGNQPAAASVSLSHRAGIAACVVAMPGVQLGCDLEVVEPRSDAFGVDYFTTEEQSIVAEAPAIDRQRLLALLWSAKESALKALHEGLRLDARSVIVSLSDAEFDLNGWSPMQVRHTDSRIFCGWWQQENGIGADSSCRAATKPADSLADSGVRSRRGFPMRVEEGAWHDCSDTFHRPASLSPVLCRRVKPIPSRSVYSPCSQRPTPARLELVHRTGYSNVEAADACCLPDERCERSPPLS